MNLEDGMRKRNNAECESGADRQAVRDFFWPFAALPLALLVIGCAGFSAGNHGSLYVRLGGLQQIELMVDETINQAAADPRTRRTFEGIKLPVLKQNVTAQVCVLAGGPCKYESESMRKAHHGLKISDTEFDVLVTSMRSVLERRVGEREKNELLRLLAPMKREVVGA
jgi:hemoglobin